MFIQVVKFFYQMTNIHIKVKIFACSFIWVFNLSTISLDAPTVINISHTSPTSYIHLIHPDILPPWSSNLGEIVGRKLTTVLKSAYLFNFKTSERFNSTELMLKFFPSEINHQHVLSWHQLKVCKISFFIYLLYLQNYSIHI